MSAHLPLCEFSHTTVFEFAQYGAGRKKQPSEHQFCSQNHLVHVRSQRPTERRINIFLILIFDVQLYLHNSIHYTAATAPDWLTGYLQECAGVPNKVVRVYARKIYNCVVKLLLFINTF